MKYDVKAGGETIDITLIERLSYDDHQTFHDMLTALDAAPGRRIVFDLSRLAFIDSAGLGMLIVADGFAAQRGMSVRIRGAYGVVRQLMDLVNFHTLIPAAEP